MPIANEALVFFTDKDNKASDISTEQIKKIYIDNGITNWKEIGGDDIGLAAYCRNNDSGSHAQMEKFILDGKSISEDISKERTSYIMASILTDVDGYNHTHTDSIAMGYSLYFYYPYTTNYYAVVRDEENPKVDKFIELLKSDFGDELVSASGLGVMTEKN